MEEQNRVLKKIYNRLYDLEKAYFRHNVTRKPSKTEVARSQSPERTVPRKRNAGSVSILGAVAAAGRHIAERRASLGDPSALGSVSLGLGGGFGASEGLGSSYLNKQNSKNSQGSGQADHGGASRGFAGMKRRSLEAITSFMKKG